MAELGVGMEGGPGAGHEGGVGAGFDAGVEAGSQVRMEEVDGELLGIPALWRHFGFNLRHRQQGRRTHYAEFWRPQKSWMGVCCKCPSSKVAEYGRCCCCIGSSFVWSLLLQKGREDAKPCSSATLCFGKEPFVSFHLRKSHLFWTCFSRECQGIRAEK